MRRPFDIVFTRALVRAHRATASEAASALLNLGTSANNNVSARDTMGVVDVGAVGGTTPSMTIGGFDGTNDGSTFTNQIGAPALTSPVTAAGGQFIDLPSFRQYRWEATTITGTSPTFDYAVYIVGMAATTPVTQAI